VPAGNVTLTRSAVKRFTMPAVPLGTSSLDDVQLTRWPVLKPNFDAARTNSSGGKTHVPAGNVTLTRSAVKRFTMPAVPLGTSSLDDVQLTR